MGTCTYTGVFSSTVGADKREPQREKSAAYAVSRCCIPRRFSTTTRTIPGIRARTRAHFSRAAHDCVRALPRDFAEAHLRGRSLMNSYLFLDRVPSELEARRRPDPLRFPLLVRRHRNSPLSAIVSRISIACSRGSLSLSLSSSVLLPRFNPTLAEA